MGTLRIRSVHALVVASVVMLAANTAFAQKRAVFGARAGSFYVLSDTSSREAVQLAEFVNGLERVARSLDLPATETPVTLLVLDNESDLAQIEPALVSEVPSRRYFAEDEAFIVLRHGVRHFDELLASEYARFVLHEVMWNPPPWFERGFARFFANAVLKQNGNIELASTCDAGFLKRLRRNAGSGAEVDVPGQIAAPALIARFGLRGAMVEVSRLQAAGSEQSALLGEALARPCIRFDPPGEPLRIKEGSAEVQVRQRRDLLDRIASLQLRTREGSASGIAYYRHQLKDGRDVAIAYREIGIGYALRGETGSAIPYLQEAVRQSPDDFAANLYLGVQCAYETACDLAAVGLNAEALAQRPSNPFVHYISAQRALSENRKHAAMAFMQRALELRGGDPELHRAYVGVALIAGELSAAEVAINRLKLWPDSGVRESAVELESILQRQMNQSRLHARSESNLTSAPNVSQAAN